MGALIDISQLADLERALRDNPDDAELALVYADAIGGERGEHIVLANVAAPTKEQAVRERVLRRAALSTTKLARVSTEARSEARVVAREPQEAALADHESQARLEQALARGVT